IFLSSKKPVDLYVGVDNFNAFWGVILKKLGWVKEVVYYTIDYVPVRFQNPVLNDVYHWMDKFCVRNADVVWNVSPRIAEGREEFHNVDIAHREKHTVAPIGVWL